MSRVLTMGKSLSTVVTRGKSLSRMLTSGKSLSRVLTRGKSLSRVLTSGISVLVVSPLYMCCWLLGGLAINYLFQYHNSDLCRNSYETLNINIILTFMCL